MIFFRFIGKKYLIYVAGVSLALATLYTFVEVLEKLARYSDVSPLLMLHYAAIVFIPSFIMLFPISTLLSTILLLREMLLRDYSVLMAVYGIHVRRIIGVVGMCSLLLSGGIMVMHETIGYKLTRRMVHAKVWLFKRDAPTQEWLRLGATSFILGLGNEQFYLLEGGAHSSVTVGTKGVDDSNNLMRVNFQEETLTQLQDVKLDLSGLDALTYTAAEVPLRRAIAQLSSRYGQQIVADLFYMLLKILLLPMFALAAFFLTMRFVIIRWLCVGLPYIGLGVGHACAALLGPLIGLGVFTLGCGFLLGYFFIKLK